MPAVSHTFSSRSLASAMAMLALLVTSQVTAAATAPAAKAPLGVGPFKLGMSLDEVKAAAPGATWRDAMVSKVTGRVFAISSVEPVQVAGVDFDVAALAHYYQHGLRFDAAERVKDASACEQSGLALLAAIESQAGPFASDAPRTVPPGPTSLQWHVQRSTSGSIGLTPSAGLGSPGRTEGEAVPFGSASTALVEAFDDQYRSRSRKQRLGRGPAYLQVTAFNRGPDHTVEASVEYGDSDGFNCTTRLELQRWTQPPLPKPFDGSKAKIVSQMTIAERHMALPEGAEPVRQATDVELRCDIDRVQGWTHDCGIVSPDGLTAGQRAAALRQARALVFDMTGVDRDDPQMMRGPVYVRLDPADRKPIDFLETEKTTLADVVFDDRPEAEDIVRVYPPDAQEARFETDVMVTCRIEIDGSLLCGRAVLADSPYREAFVFGAYHLAGTRYRAAPMLRSGGPSAGRVIELPINFRMTP